MAINKFITNVRQLIIQNDVLSILKTNIAEFDENEYNQFLQGETARLEPAVVKAAVDVFKLKNGSYCVAENLIGDAVIEYFEGDEETNTLSVASFNGIGKFALKNNSVPNVEYQLLKMYTAYKITKSDMLKTDINGEILEFNTFKFLRFCADIFKELKGFSTDAFYDRNGKLHKLDLNSNLPRLQNLISSKSLKRGDQSENIDAFLPKDVEFVDVIVKTNDEQASNITFQKIESYNTTPDRKFDIDEEILIAENEERAKDFVVSPSCKEYLDNFYDLSVAGCAPTCCAFYGPSGAGKTVSAQVIARELRRPYVSFKMRENSDEDSLKGTIKSINGKEILYEDTPVVKALKNGWVCEIQELSVATNQGAETFFNPILDKSKTFEDATGKTFNVHPDALLIFTFNPNYCENNQIATSLLNRIEDQYMIEFPNIETACRIIQKETLFTDVEKLRKIYKLCFGDGTEMASIRNYLEENDIEEELSLRQVINWIKRYMTCRRYYNQDNGWVNAAEHTIIQTLGQRELEVQEDIRGIIDAVM